MSTVTVRTAADLAGVPALTLKNPWSLAIPSHGKNVENRGWGPPDHVDRILIHAGKAWDPWPAMVSVVDRAAVATSAIVAVADIAHACDSSLNAHALRCGCGPWAMPGQWHWVLANVLALPEPVPATGKLGLWRPDQPTLRTVAAQLPAVTR